MRVYALKSSSAIIKKSEDILKCSLCFLTINYHQEKLETMLRQNLGGTNKEYYGIFWSGLLLKPSINMLLAKGVEIQIFYEIATRTLFNRMHHIHFGFQLEIRARDIWLRTRRNRGPVSRKYGHGIILSSVDLSSNTSASPAIFIV